MVEQPPSVEVFCSYAPEDEVWLDKLINHLKLLERQGLMLIWHNRLLTAGTDWAQETDDRLNRASLILLLISPDFVASDYCYSIEMQRALERDEANEARVIPILVRPVGNWQIAPFARLHPLPPDKFLIEWPEREEDIPLAQIATGIRSALQNLPTPATNAPRANQPTLWNVPYPRNPLFTGRAAELDAIEAAFREGQHAAIVQAISGLGGIGKTQLALEYAYRHRPDYRYVFWALADTRDTLNAAYGEIANLLNLPERQQREQHRVVEAVKNWLTTHQDWLLILDNADDLHMVRDFLPTSAPGHILLTTRAHAMGRLAERIEIKKLETEEAISFLLRRSTLLHKNTPKRLIPLPARLPARSCRNWVACPWLWIRQEPISKRPIAVCKTTWNSTVPSEPNYYTCVVVWLLTIPNPSRPPGNWLLTASKLATRRRLTFYGSVPFWLLMTFPKQSSDRE